MILSKTLFFVTAAATTIFIVTILAMVAMLVGDPTAPVNLWFNVHGATVMTAEVVAIGLFGMSAVIADIRETSRDSAKKGGAKSPANDRDAEATAGKT